MEPDHTFKASINHNLAEIDTVVDSNFSGMRLDQFVSLQLPEISRSVVSTSVRDKAILVGGLPKKNSYRLRVGDRVTGSITLEQEVDLHPEKIDFPILYEDEWLLFLSKPPDLVVHPGSGNSSGTLVNGLLYHFKDIAGVGDSGRPGIVHRLDKDTSGIMVVAKTGRVHRELVDIFKDHRLVKEYLALVHGIPKETEGRIVTSIGRHPVRRQKMAVTEMGGKHAATNWKVVTVLENNISLVKLRIETGRTHQIRVHMAHIGCPVAGDLVYGRSYSGLVFPRQMLHAHRLSFEHPITSKSINLKAPLWQDFSTMLSGLGGDEVLELL